uniref:Uncharacterized protein n=1 Tax=Myoviridae sp. ctZ2t4 TaxID=2827693 RepID=A0A8S5SRZ6_9CAUD|nr:MAG TPA: hypothetical protein [Myoviridae sp. ctZ2t4]
MSCCPSKKSFFPFVWIYNFFFILHFHSSNFLFVIIFKINSPFMALLYF